MRANDSVVFVDAGPVGMAGRGGHGHNDCLSVDITLAGTPLIVDPGAYVYTSDWQARNWFRSTAAHNTPQIDGEEINRFVNPKYLWLLSNDAVPEIHEWSTDKNQLRLTASHSGYQRLAAPVTPARTIILDASTERLAIIDQFDGSIYHSAQVRLVLAPGIDVSEIEPSAWKLSTANNEFLLVTQTDSAVIHGPRRCLRFSFLRYQTRNEGHCLWHLRIVEITCHRATSTRHDHSG